MWHQREEPRGSAHPLGALDVVLYVVEACGYAADVGGLAGGRAGRFVHLEQGGAVAARSDKWCRAAGRKAEAIRLHIQLGAASERARWRLTGRAAEVAPAQSARGLTAFWVLRNRV